MKHVIDTECRAFRCKDPRLDYRLWLSVRMKDLEAVLNAGRALNGHRRLKKNMMSVVHGMITDLKHASNFDRVTHVLFTGTPLSLPMLKGVYAPTFLRTNVYPLWIAMLERYLAPWKQTEYDMNAIRGVITPELTEMNGATECVGMECDVIAQCDYRHWLITRMIELGEVLKTGRPLQGKAKQKKEVVSKVSIMISGLRCASSFSTVSRTMFVDDPLSLPMMQEAYPSVFLKTKAYPLWTVILEWYMQQWNRTLHDMNEIKDMITTEITEMKIDRQIVKRKKRYKKAPKMRYTDGTYH